MRQPNVNLIHVFHLGKSDISKIKHLNTQEHFLIFHYLIFTVKLMLVHVHIVYLYRFINQKSLHLGVLFQNHTIFIFMNLITMMIHHISKLNVQS